ncbi:MAG: SUMF1/EgtB/PvdO family nonheme iron enzyme [Aggregatilineales bacterium]
MLINYNTRQKLIDLLIPHVNTVADRQTLINNAFWNTSLPGQINYDGNPRNFASQLLDVVLNYGTLEESDNEHALIRLLTQIQIKVGADKQREIENLIHHISEQTEPHQTPAKLSGTSNDDDDTIPVRPWADKEFDEVLTAANSKLTTKAEFKRAISGLRIALTRKPEPEIQRHLEKTLDFVKKDFAKYRHQQRLVREYNLISKMIRLDARKSYWCGEFLNFRRKTPNYDPDGLAEICAISRENKPEVDKHQDILDWIDIPGKDYSISKYPVTNVQFHQFYHAGGYHNKRWWTERGWLIRQTEGWEHPLYMNDPAWNGDNHPVVGVSWYEAVAFCLWLSELTGHAVMLPTEDQWRYAAQGTTDYVYPWGDNWNCRYCNNSVKPCDSDHTTAVMDYEDMGRSSFGVVDMAGNVWEWCLTDYDSLHNEIHSVSSGRVLRGGSWRNGNRDGFRCDCRNRDNPAGRDNGIGFRVARPHRIDF